MEITIYLSKILGPLFLILGAAFLVSQDHYMDLFNALYKRPGVLFLAAMIELTSGLAMAISHPYWSTFPQIIISLIAWGLIIEGSLLIIWTKPYMRIALRLLSPSLIMLGAIVGVVAGMYLTWFAYMM